MPLPPTFEALPVFPCEASQASMCLPAMEADMSTAIANYGDWDLLYANALLEPDGERLPERISAAETAINERLKAIAHQDNAEKGALVDALRALQALRSRRGRTQIAT